MTATPTPQDLERINRQFRVSRLIGSTDYCDKCRHAQAVARATVGSTDLYFCKRHLGENREALESNPSILLYVKEAKS